MTQPNPESIQDLLEIRKQIAAAEEKFKRSRVASAAFKFAVISAPIVFIASMTSLAFIGSSVDFGPFGLITFFYLLACAATAISLGIIHYDTRSLLTPGLHRLALEDLHDKLALDYSGAQIGVGIRQYSFRGAMQRAIIETRKRSDRYRRVNSGFQSLIIIGSLATTTVASLSSGSGVFKWCTVGLSFVVGLAAGFTGYFKYRERAFYLRQTADDLEKELNAYDLGLQPFSEKSEPARIQLLTERLEAIRVAQQQREQQLDQPKSGKDES